MAIDRMDWHYEGDYPQDLPAENGGTHIGLYLAWAFDRGLYAEEHLEDWPDELEQLKSREITGLDFLIIACDGKLIEDDFNEKGCSFTLNYYDWQPQSDFNRQLGCCYMQDYCDVFNAHAKSQGFEYPSVYHVENTWENFERLKPLLDRRFNQWQHWRKHARPSP